MRLRINEFTETRNQGEIMKVTEATLTTCRFTRLAAIVAGLAVAMMLLAGMQASSAHAVDAVGNPGTFTATWNGTSLKYGNQTMPTGGSFTMQVAADGTFTASGITFPLSVAGPPNPKSSDSEFRDNDLTPVATGAWGGTIDPVSGAMTLSGALQIDVWSRNAGYYGTLGTNRNATGCTVSTAVTVSPSGNNYNWHDGTVGLHYGPFTGGAATGCAARSGIFGGSTRNMDGAVNDAWGMNGSNNTLDFALTIKNAAGEPIKPWPVRPSFTATPDPVGEGNSVTFNASASGIDSGVQACPSEDPSEPNCGYRWDFDGDGSIDAVTNGPTITHVYNNAGVKNPTLTIFDADGLSGTWSRSVTVQIKPVAQIDTHPAAVTKETVNSFTFSIPSNPDSATTQCSIDGGAWNACISGDDFTFNQADDTTGTHNFRVRGITPGGVTGPAAEYDFTIDRVKPRVTIDPASEPANPTNQTFANFQFTADKPNTTLECQLDGGSWQPCGSNSTGSQSYSNLSQSSPRPIEAPNPHKFRVRATDQYGNVGGDGNPGGGGYDWDIDLTSPQINLDVKPANPSNEVDPVFGWVNNESIQRAQCRLNVNGVQSLWKDCDSLTGTTYSDLDDNTYQFSVRTLDIAGNWSNVVSWTWVLDTVNPDLTITSAPAPFTNRALAQFTFNAPADNTTLCQLDGGSAEPCESGVKYQYLSEGSHTFIVTAIDPALNETSKSYTWSVKTVQPVVSIDQNSVPAKASTTDAATFDLVTANGTAECSLDGAAWSDCDSDEAQSYSDLTQGNHTFQVRALDEYGNVSATDGFAWLVVTEAPQVSLQSPPPAVDRFTTATFQLDVDSADPNVTTVCAIDGIAFDCANPAVVVGLSEGEHVFEVTATDTAGQSVTVDHRWTVKSVGPALTFDQTPAALSNSAQAKFSFESDDEEATLACSLDGATLAACSSPVNLTGLSDGSHSFRIRATDEAGNQTTETYEWRVDTVAPKVTFNSTPPATTTDVAELIEFTVSESGSTLSCTLDGEAFADCSSPALVMNLGVGEHSFAVKATDAAGNTGPTASVAWTVQTATEPGPAPKEVVADPAPPTNLRAPANGDVSGEAADGKSATGKSAKGKSVRTKQLKKQIKRLTKKAKRLARKGQKRKAQAVRARAQKKRNALRALRGLN